MVSGDLKSVDPQAQNRRLAWRIIGSGLIGGVGGAVIAAVAWLLANVNYAYGGNAELSPTSSVISVVKPNTEWGAHGLFLASQIGVFVLPIASAILVGRWRYRRYLANHRP